MINTSKTYNITGNLAMDILSKDPVAPASNYENYLGEVTNKTINNIIHRERAKDMGMFSHPAENYHSMMLDISAGGVTNKISAINKHGERKNVAFFNSLEDIKQNKVRFNNDQTGYDPTITKLTFLRPKLVMQKIFEEEVFELVKIEAGTGAFMDSIRTWYELSHFNDIETGVSRMGSSQLPASNFEIGSADIPVLNWGNIVSYSIMDLNQYAAAGIGTPYIEVREKVQMKIWNRLLQNVIMYGVKKIPGIYGLLNQPGITTDATIIATPFATQTPAQLNVVIANMLNKYQKNTGLSELNPDTLVMPRADYNAAMTRFISPTFPINGTVGQFLEEAFQRVTGNKNFKVVPTYYADKSATGASYNTYVLYRREDEDAPTAFMPVPYTSTAYGTANGYQYESVSYGQFTGVFVARPKEMVYFTNTFDFTASF